MNRRMCIGDPYGIAQPNKSCISPATGFFVTVGVLEDGPATLVVSCCDRHQAVVEDWLQSVSIAEGIYAPIAALDDPTFAADLFGSPNTYEYVAQSA